MGSFLRLLWVAMGFTLLNGDFARDIFQKWFGERVFLGAFGNHLFQNIFGEVFVSEMLLETICPRTSFGKCLLQKRFWKPFAPDIFVGKYLSQ